MLKLIASFVVYFLEVTLSTFVLGVALGFSRPFAFAAALWLAFLLFPPFNFVFGLQGWLGTAPLYGHTLVLSNLLLVAFIRIGTPTTAHLGFMSELVRNWLLASCIFLLVLLIVLVAPFYNGGLLIGTFLLAGVIFLSSRSFEQMLWRAGAGMYVLACAGAFHFYEFLAGAKASSARFSDAETNLLQMRWPGELSASLLVDARTWLCGAGLLCDRLSQWPGALTGSLWLQAAIIFGGIAIAIRVPPPLSRIGLLWSALWVGLLLVWIAVSLGAVGPFPFAPIYFYLMMYPFWAFFSLFSGQTLIEAIKARLAPRARPLDRRWGAAALCAAALALLALFHASPRHVLDWRSPLRRVNTPITEILRQEISLRPGQSYRGSVATLIGAPESPLRRQLLENPEQPLRPSDFESFLRTLAIATGSTHDLLDLWWADIPTLSEYGQGRPKELMFYVTGILNSIADPPDYNFAFPRLANVDLLRAMGVRFVVTDLSLPSDQAVVRHTMPLKGDVDLYLYELPNPNVTGFSPLKVSGQITPSQLLQRIRSEIARIRGIRG
jgi:hypothetical protein